MDRKVLSLYVLIFFSCTGDTEMLILRDSNVVFISGQEGYKCFRIPAIIQSPNGDLLAFAEGRKERCSDTNDIDLVMKRSSDGGVSWSVLQVVWDDQLNTCGNPVPIVDHITDQVILLSTWNLGEDHESEIIEQKSTDTRRPFVQISSDNGHNWTEPKEITAQVKLPEWTWYATGPGSGIQLNQEPIKGRLMAGCDHIEAGSKKYYSHVIFSDDHGITWQLGASSLNDQVNECEVAELPDGQLLLNMRNYDRTQKLRQTAISNDGGMSWVNQDHHPMLKEPICQASLQTYNYNGLAVLLFSNPASTQERVRMTLRSSFDNGITWPDSLLLYEGPSAYSDLVVTKNGIIGCLFEKGVQNPYESISYATITLDTNR